MCRGVGSFMRAHSRARQVSTFGFAFRHQSSDKCLVKIAGFRAYVSPCPNRGYGTVAFRAYAGSVLEMYRPFIFPGYTGWLHTMAVYRKTLSY